MIRLRSMCLLGIAFAAVCIAAGAQVESAPDLVKVAEKAASIDPMLSAMQAELEREQQLLLLPGMQRPYFVEYRMDDFTSFEAAASYGSLTREEHGHQRVVRVTVRIGDYASDSSSSRGDGFIGLAPEENDPEALRYALWTATDEAYKAALRGYAAKQAALKRFEKAASAEDFAHAQAVQRIEPLATLALNEGQWKSRIAEASGLFLTDSKLASAASHVQYSTANVRSIAVNRYLVNTEGTVVRHGYSGYAASYSVGGQADDGMRLGRDNGTTATDPRELESAEAFRKRVVNDVLSFEALREAPLADAEDFHGPVLFSGDASADLMNRLFVPNVEANRPEMGTAARTEGTYRSSYKAKVLPEMLDVVDDPLEAKFKGESLVGAYNVDDEGVPASRVDLVERGKLTQYLIGRTPVRDFPVSNGHGRAAPGQAARPWPGVLIVKGETPTPKDQMWAKLLALAKEQNRDVYEVETMSGEAPRLLYRVHPDGTRQLVRGAVFDELDNRSLRSDVLAVGDDAYVAQSIAPVPQTTIAPSLLFGDVGIKRANEEQQKLPYYEPPR